MGNGPGYVTNTRWGLSVSSADNSTSLFSLITHPSRSQLSGCVNCR